MIGVMSMLLAATLSAGNAEFDRAATDNAREIALSRERARLIKQGPSGEVLKKAMLEDPQTYEKLNVAKIRARMEYQRCLSNDFEQARARIDSRLGIKDGADVVAFDAKELQSAEKTYASRFETERKAACDEQAKSIATDVKPAEAEFEEKEGTVLRQEIVAKIAARQKFKIFEENAKYVDESIVEPMIADAKKEMERQREYVKRTKCESYAPSKLEAEIKVNLERNLAERKAKAIDVTRSWGVFPRTLKTAMPGEIQRRTMGRVTRGLKDAKIEVDIEELAKAIAKDRKAHIRAADSENLFRDDYVKRMMESTLVKVASEAPAAERNEFLDYVSKHIDSKQVTKEVDSRVRGELLPKLKLARERLSQIEVEKLWPTLADGTWYPAAEFSDMMAQRSDYARAVKNWRKLPEMAEFAQAAENDEPLEETGKKADELVGKAFECARAAVNEQTAILMRVVPKVLGEAKSRKDSIWRSTPDLKAIVAMLTEEVENDWARTKQGVLWPDGDVPKNAAEQHAQLFPSVKKRIEEVAKTILEEMEKPKEEKKPEEKPKPEEPPEDTPEDEPEEPLMEFKIIVNKEADGKVAVKLEQGSKTLVERKSKPEMKDFKGAMNELTEKLGGEILKLK